MLSRRTKRKILAGEYVDLDTILTEVTTNMEESPWQQKPRYPVQSAGMSATSARDFTLGLHTQLQSY